LKLPGIAIEYDTPPPEVPGPAWVADIATSIAAIERDGTDADREFAAREIARVLAIAAFKIAQRRVVAEMTDHAPGRSDFDDRLLAKEGRLPKDFDLDV